MFFKESKFKFIIWVNALAKAIKHAKRCQHCSFYTIICCMIVIFQTRMKILCLFNIG